jgi:omega-hydroxy-beta-dihydromenaquinone-9 sulfotransferase
MLKIYYRILISAYKTFGFSIVFWRWLLLLPFFFVFTPFTLFLDRIFFPDCFKLPVKAPIFIIGNPRSGTTFLHNLLTETGEFVAFETWQIFFPALTARVLVKPVIDYLIKNDRSAIIPEKSGHGVYLNKVEHDEFLFIHKLDTQFILSLSPLGFDDYEYSELRFYDQQPKSRRQSSVRFFKNCLQRQMYYTGQNQVISHAHYSICRIKTLLESFPDAKFIYLARSPYQVVPSHLSLNCNILDRLWGIKNIPSDKLKRWFERKYKYDIELYKYFYDLRKNKEIPEDNVIILRYNELHADLYESFEKIVNYTKISPSNQLRQVFRHQAQLQKSYKRKHSVMKLEEFGLTKEKIAKDFSFVFDEYNFDK